MCPGFLLSVYFTPGRTCSTLVIIIQKPIPHLSKMVAKYRNSGSGLPTGAAWRPGSAVASTPLPRVPRVAAAPTRVTGTAPGPGVTAASPTQHPEVNIIYYIY